MNYEGTLAHLGDTIDEFYDNEWSAWGYFVRGAPALCTEGIKSVRGIVNGTQLLLHDLMFDAPGPPDDYTRAYASGGFVVVTFDRPPEAIVARAGSPKAPPVSPSPGQRRRHRRRLIRGTVLLSPI